MTTQSTSLSDTLRELREQVSGLRQRNDLPAIERSLQMVDLNLHLALWQLGEAHEPMPELEPDTLGAE